MIVETIYGRIDGIREGRFEAYKNIPFAAPPVGPLRFKPPQPPQKWDGVRDCTRFGPRAMQNPAHPDNAGAQMSEADCLNLNVWTPKADGGRRPVVVHIHGGGLCFGWNSEDCFDGQHFVQEREVVLVAIQYRLGILGYLYLGELLGEEYAQSANCGLLDQLAALRWIRENIARFGGDPDNVTIMGESAGGRSVGGLLALPAAQGLFHKAILQSGAIQSIRDRHTASVLARKTLKEGFGLESKDARQLLTLPAEAIIAGQARLEGGLYLPHTFGPVIDGINLKEPPQETIARGALKDIPVLIGCNRDELRTPVQPDDFTPAFIDHCLANFGLNRPHVEAEYLKRLESMDGPDAMADIMTTYVYGNHTLALAALLAKGGSPVWLYRWDHDQNNVPLAAHFTEMPYIFDFDEKEYHKGFPDTAQNHALAKRMNAIWNNFILNGTPQTSGLPEWPAYSEAGPGVRMHLCAQPYGEAFDLARDYDREMPYQVIRL